MKPHIKVKDGIYIWLAIGKGGFVMPLEEYYFSKRRLDNAEIISTNEIISRAKEHERIWVEAAKESCGEGKKSMAFVIACVVCFSLGFGLSIFLFIINSIKGLN